MTGDALLLVDLFTEFDPAHAGALPEALTEAVAPLRRAVDHAQRRSLPVVYVSDAGGDWRGDRREFVARSLEHAPARLAQLSPSGSDLFLFKPGYSAFRQTPLEHVLRTHDVEHVLAGAATEMCVAQTAIDARESGFKVTILRDACAHQDAELSDISLRYIREIAGGFVWTVEGWIHEQLSRAAASGSADRDGAR
jgi:nicotinamidase-related amidase